MADRTVRKGNRLHRSTTLSRGIGGFLILFPLLAACATSPSQSPYRAASSAAEPALAVRHSQPSLLEESNVGEDSALAPPPTAAPSAPAVAPMPPTPLENAALSPPPAPSPTADALADSGSSVEPDSLLNRIEPGTPPNVAAALRLVQDGRQQLRQEHYNRALDRFERALAIDPTSAYGYYYLAKLHFLTKKYDQAIAFASRAAVLSAHTDRVWLARVYSLEGAIFEEVGRFPDARKAYQKAVDADPNNLAARVGVVRLSAAE